MLANLRGFASSITCDHSPCRDVAHVLPSPLTFFVYRLSYLILLMMVISSHKIKARCTSLFTPGTASGERKINFAEHFYVFGTHSHKTSNSRCDVPHSPPSANHSGNALCSKVGMEPAIVRNTSSGTTSNCGPSLSRIPLTRLTSLVSRTCTRRK